MKCQLKGPPMDGEEHLSFQVQLCLAGIFRPQMDLPPVGMVGTDLEHGQVKGPVSVSDVLEPREHPAVTAEIDTVDRTCQNPGCPESFVSVKKSPS